MKNPFIFGPPVHPQNLIGRTRELRRISGRILNQGQSSALIGEPRTGKTSILNYLMSPISANDLYGTDADKLLFAYVDAQTLGGNFIPSKFWEFVVEPVRKISKKNPLLSEALKICHQEKYGNFVLERLFSRLQDSEIILVLLLDEFDVLVDHVGFQQAEFYGGLRALASRYSSLAMVIASRQTLTEINLHTQEFSRNGSPFSNIMYEVFIGPLSEKEIKEMLVPAESKFTSKDRKYLNDIAGSHPYLMQVACSMLWEMYEDGKMNPTERLEIVGETFFGQVSPALSDTWRLWNSEMKKAFTIIALDELPILIGGKQFDINSLIAELTSYTPELRELKKRGFICEDSEMVSGWSIDASVMLWWIADEWIKALRKQDDLSLWLNNQGWDGGILKNNERKQLIGAVKGTSLFLKDGVQMFIKAAAEGFGKGVSNS